MKTRIELETLTDVKNFCEAVSSITTDVFLTDTNKSFKVNAKSTIGTLLAHVEWGEIYCECEEDIYSTIEPWVARNSNISEHN